MKKIYLTLSIMLSGLFLNAQIYEYSLSFEGINAVTGNYQIALIATPDFEQATAATTSDIGAAVYLPSNCTIGNFAPGNAGFQTFEWSAIQEVSYDGGITDLIQIYRQVFVPNNITHTASQPLTLIKFDIISETGGGNPTNGQIIFADDYTDSGSGNTYESYLNVDLTGGNTQDYFSNFDLSANSINFSTLSVDNLNIAEANISIYPNPTKSRLNIETNKTISYSIFNILGQSVKLAGEIENNSIKSINLSHLPDGIYILKAEDDNNNSKSFKIIKKE